MITTGPAWLFCPADRPDRYAKAAARADVVILDLEDAVAPAAKAAARESLGHSDLDPARTVVRVSPVGPERVADLEALAGTAYATVMAAKSERPDDLAALAPFRVVALVETPRGVLAAAELAAVANVVGLMWGAEDLVAGLGGLSSRTRAGGYRDVARHARSTVLLASAAHARFAIDAVHLDLDDLDGLSAEAEDAAAVGFGATACIHPRQVDVVRSAYRPAAELVDWAERVLAAARTAPGVFSFEGQMIDAPVLRQAELIMARTTPPAS